MPRPASMPQLAHRDPGPVAVGALDRQRRGGWCRRRGRGSRHGRARRQVHGEHLGPLVVVAAVAVDDDPGRPSLGDDPRAHQRAGDGAGQEPEQRPASTRWKIVNRARISGPTANHASDADHHAAGRRRSSTREPDAERAPGVRAAPDRAQRRQAWMSVSRMARAPMVVELVHQPLGAGARHHRPHRHPALAMQRRDRRALDARASGRPPRRRRSRGMS